MWTKSVFRQAFLSWIAFILVECLLGAFRQKVLEPRFSMIAVEIFGLVTGICVACIVAYWFLHKGWFPAQRPKLYGIGILWIVFTIVFEFLFFSLVMGHERSVVIDAYRMDQGRLFVLGLIALLFIPMAVAQRNGVID